MDSIYNKKYGTFVGSGKGYVNFRNNLRINKFTGMINPREKDKILEIGSNKGLLLSNLAKFSKDAIGIDINKEQVAENGNDKITHMSATDLKFASNTFDKVCAFEVIEHIPDIKKVFSEVFRVLKKDGEFIISFPFEIIRGQSALLDAFAIYKNPLFARKLHVHKLTPGKIKRMIKNIPFAKVESKIAFIPFPSFIMILKK